MSLTKPSFKPTNRDIEKRREEIAVQAEKKLSDILHSDLSIKEKVIAAFLIGFDVGAEETVAFISPIVSKAKQDRKASGSLPWEANTGSSAKLPWEANS